MPRRRNATDTLQGIDAQLLADDRFTVQFDDPLGSGQALSTFYRCENSFRPFMSRNLQLRSADARNIRSLTLRSSGYRSGQSTAVDSSQT